MASGAPTSHDRTDRSQPPVQPDYQVIGHRMSRAAMVLQPLCLVLVLAFSAAWVVVWSSLPRIEGRHPVAGVQLGATITRDALGVPRIAAKSDHDAYFALGWVHAQDRMWQMEIQRRVGAGRLAELAGEAGLANDRFMRTLGVYRQAQRDYDHLDRPTRDALTSYAAGVNAWLTEYRFRLPMEYVATGLRPEPWSAADSLVWQKLMALQLAGNWADDILRAQLVRTLDPKRVQELFPPSPADAPVTLSAEGGRALLQAVPDSAATAPASNIWVLAGGRTASGKPLLANDPHLGFRAPILWYLAEIEAPGVRLTGATVPGVPFHVIAHNHRIAWGFTSTQADTIDLFVEKLAGTKAYKAPDGNRPFVTRDEIIKVKDAADITLAVRETRHGPVISDLAAGQGVAGSGEVLAFSSTLLADKDLTAQALRRMGAARDWNGFTAALKDLHAPVLNVGYADMDGNIGFMTAGRLPLRKSGNGMVPARGWTPEGDWTGWVPVAKLPQVFNPKGGLLINANNKVTGDKLPLITASWPEGYRAQRLKDVLEAKGLPPASVSDMAALQADALSLQAIEFKELLSGHEFRSDAARQAAQRLTNWDGRADRDRAEPLIHAAWLNRLNRAVFADELKERFEAVAQPRPTMLMEALTRRRHWCDDTATPEPESCEDMVERSLEQALDDLAAAWGPDQTQWAWGKAHQARFDNAVLGRVPLLGRLANLAIATDGDDFTVARGSYRAEVNGGSFPHLHGAGLRVVFDLSDLSASRFVIATGQSGQPLSRHYDDMLRDWRDGRLPWPTAARDKAVLTLERNH